MRGSRSNMWLRVVTYISDYQRRDPRLPSSTRRRNQPDSPSSVPDPGLEPLRMRFASRPRFGTYPLMCWPLGHQLQTRPAWPRLQRHRWCPGPPLRATWRKRCSAPIGRYDRRLSLTFPSLVASPFVIESPASLRRLQRSIPRFQSNPPHGLLPRGGLHLGARYDQDQHRHDCEQHTTHHGAKRVQPAGTLYRS